MMRFFDVRESFYLSPVSDVVIEFMASDFTRIAWGLLYYGQYEPRVWVADDGTLLPQLLAIGYYEIEPELMWLDVDMRRYLRGGDNDDG